jgi:hypothetical protein
MQLRSESQGTRGNERRVTRFVACVVQLTLVKLGLWESMSTTAAVVVLALLALTCAVLLLSIVRFGVFVLGGLTFSLLVNALHQMIASRVGSGGDTGISLTPTLLRDDLLTFRSDAGTTVRVVVLVLVFVAGGVFALKVWKRILYVRVVL